MPELPEVETLRRTLARSIIGETVAIVTLSIPKMLKEPRQDVDRFKAALIGTSVKDIQRRGKHLIFELSSGYYLLFHLKMRGQMIVVPTLEPIAKYHALSLSMASGKDLRFHDIWTWGEFRLLDADELEKHAPLVKMGVEPLSEDFTIESLQSGFKRRSKSAIKAVLLDQSIVAGIGNIYADESLFRARIKPTRLAGNLTAEETLGLRDRIRDVLESATGGGGTVSDNYVDADGNAGNYHPQVYDKAGEPCPDCGAPLTKIRVAGRGTVYCTECQV